MPIATEMPVIGILFGRSIAHRAIDALHSGGIRAEDIAIAMRGRGLTPGTKAADGIGQTGIGRLISVFNMMVPGVGRVFCAGSLGAALSNASDGDLVAGITGALVGTGVPEENVGFYR